MIHALAHLQNVISGDNVYYGDSLSPRIRRGGYVFIRWIGDHPPPHVHVYREGRLIVKWDLDRWRPIQGKASRPVVRLLRELVEEQRL